ncbi:chitin binding peritrophin-A domain-containing protein [Nocardia salmonicida]|uniref:chitin binding peritrophin-A domain-containing protein n=1 Tax=Nocardia salmonicida TaxID=53431 RepID=UPI0033CFC8E6
MPTAGLLLSSALTLAAASSALAEDTGVGIAAFNCPEPDGLFPYPGDVAKSVECSNNVSTAHTCPSGLNWNRHAQYCDWPSSAGAVTDRYQSGNFVDPHRVPVVIA